MKKAKERNKMGVLKGEKNRNLKKAKEKRKIPKCPKREK